MKFSFETETQLLPEQIWPLYATTDNWFLWEDDLEAISLNGNFETGTTGNMKLKGQPSLSFILTSAEKIKNLLIKHLFQMLQISISNMN